MEGVVGKTLAKTFGCQINIIYIGKTITVVCKNLKRMLPIYFPLRACEGALY
jgi:hypothetical protein